MSQRSFDGRDFLADLIGCWQIFGNTMTIQQVINAELVNAQRDSQLVLSDVFFSVKVYQQRFLSQLVEIANFATERVFQLRWEFDTNRHSLFLQDNCSTIPQSMANFAPNEMTLNWLPGLGGRQGAL